ncbi:MAG TPA: ferredoxin reductase [Candidatus Udaeobacter sp.]|nr:ferredoxin reductase [Candidatus Udaeobacter sp.]
MSSAISWQLAEVVELQPQTPAVASIFLNVPDWPGHAAGQHVDVRLTAEDGYQAQRSYSIASAPRDARLELTVERLEDGEVSPYLVGELRVGDKLELRGPIGGYFVWRPEGDRPLMLVAGGSGVVPLMAMLRHRQSASQRPQASLLYSSRTVDDVIYRDELERIAVARDGVSVRQTLTRAQPPGWTGFARRVDESMLRESGWPAESRPEVFICGPTAFVETVASLLVDMGYQPDWIKTERFGPTGG